jgi:4-hydroxybenzoate polyprenyltransferase
VIQFIAICRLARVENCLLAMLGVWLGAYLTPHPMSYYGPLMAGLAAFFVCAGGNVVNDMIDLAADRVNRPDRVLPRQQLSMVYARNLAILFHLLAVICALSVNITVTVVVLVVAGLLMAYNLKLKQTVLFGNLTIALLAGLTFLCGGIVVNPLNLAALPGPLVPAVFAFFFHLVREILKDVEDIEGDREAGIQSFPMVVGRSTALLTALGLFVFLAVLTYVPIIMNWYGPSYKLVTVYLVDLPLIALLIFIWGNPTSTMLHTGSIGLKIGMVLGLIALTVSGIS